LIANALKYTDKPDAFVEMSRELAAEKGIRNGDKVKVKTARGEIEVYALVTARMKPFLVDGKEVHQVAIPYHFGFSGLGRGASANMLTPHAGDANTMIPEYKAFLCDVEKAEGRMA
ncbi:MAG: molybdopterin dinucleotide binding domain-containing protein, partial [Myxococcota bacterium]